MPELYRQLSYLDDKYSIPNESSTVLVPYPFGCNADLECFAENKQHIIPSMQCHSACNLLIGSSAAECRNPSLLPCYLALFAQDEVHPSYIGHALIKDLIVDVLAHVSERRCRAEPLAPEYIPRFGLLAQLPVLRVRTRFLLVNETEMSGPHGVAQLHPVRHSKGWTMYADRANKKGWIADEPNGGECIEFALNLPQKASSGASACYALFLGVLRSYRGMGRYNVTVRRICSPRLPPPPPPSWPSWPRNVCAWASTLAVSQ